MSPKNFTQLKREGPSEFTRFSEFSPKTGFLDSQEFFLKVLIFVKIIILTDSSHNFPKVPQVKFTFSVAEKDKIA